MDAASTYRVERVEGKRDRHSSATHLARCNEVVFEVRWVVTNNLGTHSTHPTRKRAQRIAEGLNRDIERGIRDNHGRLIF